jgi:hypothetical protein
MHGLPLVGRRVAIVHQCEEDDNPVAEPLQLEIPVEPPPRVLLPEQDHEQWPEEETAAGTVGNGAAAMREGVAGNALEHDQDRNRDKDSQRRRQPAQASIG